MKSVLISIQPKWCELIASGKKTVEVRKTKPKLETPFKVYIYATKSGDRLVLKNDKVYEISKYITGKVIGEFVCDKICEFEFLENGEFQCRNPVYLGQSCLTYDELINYIGKNKIGYGWHISDLVIYDTPKELGEFYTVDNEAVKQCEYRERVYNNPDYTNGAWLLGSYVCNKGEINWCTKCKTKPIARPPQSWCYVEGVSL